MYPVSLDYQEKIKENNRLFKSKIQIQHSQGVLNLTDKELGQGTLTYTESSQAGEEFTIGSTVASDISFTILNKPEYDDIKFMGATVTCNIGLLVEEGADAHFMQPSQPSKMPGFEEKWEYVPLGRFNIDYDPRQRNTIELKAIDNMIKLDISYSLSKLSYPATLYQIYINICNVGDIVVGTHNFPNKDYIVKERPDGDLTLRDVLGYVAELAGCFSKCNRNGALELLWYKPTGLTLEPSNRFDFKPSDDEVRIKGIIATVDDTTYLAGSDDYAIDLTDNPLLQGGHETVLRNIYNNVKDTVFTPYTSNWQGNMALQAGDIITQVDRDGKAHNTLVTKSIYKYRGKSILEAKGLPEISKGYKGSTDRKIAQIKRKIDIEVGDKLTSMEEQILASTELIANMLGGYAIKADDAFYIADNKDLSKAMKVWKWGLGGFGYSENGIDGPYTTAITADGSIVAMLVAANIVTANMVQTGILQSEDGSTWINLDNGEFNFKNILKFIGGVFNKIDAVHINASTLSAISADLGNVTSGNMVGATIKTADRGARIELTEDLLKMYSDSNTLALSIPKIVGSGQDDRIIIHDLFGNKIGTIGALRNSFSLVSHDGNRSVTACDLDIRSGLFEVSGNIEARDINARGQISANGAKPATVYTESYGLRKLYALEHPEIKFEDDGIANLVDGICRINIDPVFLETIEKDSVETPYIIHLTPYDWLNIRVKEVHNDYFIIEEKDGLSGKFSWRFTATRKGFKGTRLPNVGDTKELIDDNWEDEIEDILAEQLDLRINDVLNDDWSDILGN